MKRDFVSLTDILVLYYQKDRDYYKTFACSKEIGYGELKKAFSDVIRVYRVFAFARSFSTPIPLL